MILKSFLEAREKRVASTKQDVLEEVAFDVDICFIDTVHDQVLNACEVIHPCILLIHHFVLLSREENSGHFRSDIILTQRSSIGQLVGVLILFVLFARHNRHFNRLGRFREHRVRVVGLSDRDLVFFEIAHYFFNLVDFVSDIRIQAFLILGWVTHCLSLGDFEAWDDLHSFLLKMAM